MKLNQSNTSSPIVKPHLEVDFFTHLDNNAANIGGTDRDFNLEYKRQNKLSNINVRIMNTGHPF